MLFFLAAAKASENVLECFENPAYIIQFIGHGRKSTIEEEAKKMQFKTVG